MKIKTLIVTVLVLAALSIAVFIARRPAPPAAADARINQSLVDSAAIDKAAKLRLSDAGKTVDLVRQADGTWRVPSYFDLPADFSKLSGFVANLTEAKIQRLVTSAPDRIARLEFKDTKVELLDASDKPVFSATLGKNAEVGGGRYVKFGSEAKAYLVNLSAFLDTEAKNWANAELLNLKADDIAQIEIPFAEGGPIVVSRAKKEDPWTADKTPAGQRIKADKVATVLSSVSNIRFSDSTAPDDANAVVAKANLRSFKVTTFDNKSVTVALGRKPEEKKLKPLAPAADGKTGPGALGSVADLTKKEEPAKDGKPADGKPLAPEFETIPAGPVFAFVAHSDPAAPVNAAMQKRAYQISDYTFTGLPQKADELFEPVPAAAPAPAPADKAKTEDKKTDSTK